MTNSWIFAPTDFLFLFFFFTCINTWTQGVRSSEWYSSHYDIAKINHPMDLDTTVHVSLVAYFSVENYNIASFPNSHLRQDACVVDSTRLFVTPLPDACGRSVHRRHLKASISHFLWSFISMQKHHHNPCSCTVYVYASWIVRNSCKTFELLTLAFVLVDRPSFSHIFHQYRYSRLHPCCKFIVDSNVQNQEASPVLLNCPIILTRII